MFGRKKNRITEQDCLDYIFLICDFLCTLHESEGYDEAQQRMLIDHFSVFMSLRIGLGMLDDKRKLLALGKLQTTLIASVDEILGYSPPHKTPFDLVADMSDFVKRQQ